MATVETVYRCRIDFNIPTEDWSRTTPIERVTAYASATAQTQDVRCTWSEGGPCWNAYLTFEASSLEAVTCVVKLTERYIRRFKGAEIYE